MTCPSCKFVDVFVGEELLTYECHRYPPIVISMFKDEEDNDDEYAEVPVKIHPQVTENDWCGEYKEKEDGSGNEATERGLGGDADQNDPEGSG